MNWIKLLFSKKETTKQCDIHVVKQRFVIKELETITEIKEKLNHTGQLNASETWQIVNLIETYEKGIEELNKKVIEAEKRYSPHLHGYQMEILWKAEAIHYKTALNLFSLNGA